MKVYVLYRPGLVYRYSNEHIEAFFTLEEAQRFPLHVKPGIERIARTLAPSPGDLSGEPRRAVLWWEHAEGDAGRWDLMDAQDGYIGYSIAEKRLIGAPT